MEKKDIKISIILPVYNVENGVERAAKSLQNQTLKEFEAGFVDDGSTDKSGIICDELEKKENRFHVIHQKNAGAAEARNTALPKASGKYLYFMDPDDGCEPTMLEDMYNVANKNNLEFLVTGYYVDTYYKKDKYYRETVSAPNKIYKTRNEFRENAYKLFDAELLYAPGNKLYLNEYISKNNIIFPDTFGDDLPFNIEVLKNVEHVGSLNGHYYHFLRARAEAETSKYRPGVYEKHEEENSWLRGLYQHGNQHDKNSKNFLNKRYVERLIACIENTSCKGCKKTNKEKRNEIKNMLNTQHARESIKNVKLDSLMMKCITLPYKLNNATLSLIEGKFISYIKNNHTETFAKLLAKR